MALPGKKITELTATTTLGDTDLVPVVTDISTTPVTKKITLANVRTALAAKGDTGVQGDTGVTGDTGITGDKGDTGTQGDTGVQGDTGITGDTGEQGTQGDTGVKGDTGTKGDTGVQGDTGTKGDTGEQGDTGETGETGIAYVYVSDEPPVAPDDGQLWWDTDDTTNSTQGDTGITGDTGLKGDTGTTGAKGDTGTTGAKGDTGTTGAKGDTGSKGDTGIQGDTGVKGDTGLKGDTGEKGDTGDAGSNSFVSQETPTGDIDSSNTSFTIANTPVTGTLAVYLNGQRLTYTNDYTLSGTTITMVSAPLTGDTLLVDYFLSGSATGNADTLDGQHAPTGTIVGTTDTQTLTYKTIGTTNLISFNAPQGFLINGKIVPSVASNNLTVAIKGMDGNDPSASNPVYCRIGDTVRTITSALSVVANAGTNYFDAGSTELATKEIDYFVYLFWYANATTPYVNIGFSRIPYGGIGTDFVAASTDEKTLYFNWDGSHTLDATCQLEVIGRFAATLSAGAGYTWTVPTFTASNLIQRPIYETRWLSYLPTYSGGASMTYTSVTTTEALYQVAYRRCFFTIDTTGVLGGTAHNDMKATLPFTPLDYYTFGGGAYQNGYTWYISTNVRVVAADPYLQISRYDGAAWTLTTDSRIKAAGFYDI